MSLELNWLPDARYNRQHHGEIPPLKSNERCSLYEGGPRNKERKLLRRGTSHLTNRVTMPLVAARPSREARDRRPSYEERDGNQTETEVTSISRFRESNKTE
jgi:hypothetical protein